MTVCVIDEEELINKYLGVKYTHMGRNTNDGLDCWGLVCVVYRDYMSVDVPDISDYERNFALYGKDYFETEFCHKWIKINNPEPMSIVLFKNSRGIVDHAGICLSRNRFMQCDRHGVTVARLTDQSYAERIEGYYKHAVSNS